MKTLLVCLATLIALAPLTAAEPIRVGIIGLDN